MKFIKNRFLFIVLISAITLVLLIVGAISLYRDRSSVFDSDGYIMYCSRACTLFIKHYFCLSYIHRDDFDSTAIRVMISEMARLMCDVGSLPFLF